MESNTYFSHISDDGVFVLSKTFLWFLHFSFFASLFGRSINLLIDRTEFHLTDGHMEITSVLVFCMCVIYGVLFAVPNGVLSTKIGGTIVRNFFVL